MRLLLSSAVVVFAVADLLWFGVSFAITAQLIADGSMQDRPHIAFGYATGAVEAAAAAGWLWALVASTRARSPVSGPMQIMCVATAVAQLAIGLATIALIGVQYIDEPAGYLLGHMAIAALLADLIDRSRRRAATGRE